MRARIVLLLCGSLLFAAAGDAAKLATIDRVDAGEVYSRHFVLDTTQKVRITGTALANRRDEPFSDMWILAARTREVVWELDDADIGRSRRGIAPFEDTVSLAAGEYELYVSTVFSWFGDGDRSIGLGELIRRLVGSIERHDAHDELDRIEVTVEGTGLPGGENTPDRVRAQIARDAVVAFVAVGNDEYLRQGFALAAPTDVHVRAMGEADRDSAYDTAWISNADTGEKIWELDYWHSERAGGARKNRVADEVIHLPAGRYVATYATDSSHSYPDFNAAPPHDPMAWGLVIRLKDPQQATRVTTFQAGDALEENVLVALTEIRDNEHVSEGFTLLRPTKVRVVAIGEGTGRNMADYGWIVNARTREPIWEMDYLDTEHAGGAKKNRLANEVILLPAGSYMVHFVTDSSHAFGDWNSSPPFERGRWGITVVAADESFDSRALAPYDPAEEPGVLARIDHVRDDAHRWKEFVLERTSDVSVYAVGEGQRGRMHDFAWIEDVKSDRTVWEMTYRMTEHAGGASKNRVFRGTLHLPAGTYRVYYESDGSHSFGDWNAAPPHDPEGWGVTISAAEKLPPEAPPLPLEAPPQ